jgi:NADH-quinone oxidoreductase subunit I
MILIDIAKKVWRVTQAVTEKRTAVIDVRFDGVHKVDNFRGEHQIDYETCIGCDSCNKICPVHAITMKQLPFKKQNIVPEVNLGMCIFCGLCEDVCPTKPEKSIKLSGGRIDMITGGLHTDQDNFWVNVDIPQSYIDSRLEQEEALRVKKEMEKKKREALKKQQEEKKEKQENKTE